MSVIYLIHLISILSFHLVLTHEIYYILNVFVHHYHTQLKLGEKGIFTSLITSYILSNVSLGLNIPS